MPWDCTNWTIFNSQKSSTVDVSDVQAVLFYLPTIVWHGLNSKAGVDADSILAAAHTFTRLEDIEGSEKMLQMLVRQMDRFLSSRRPARQQSCRCTADCVKDGCQLCGRRHV